MPKILQIRKIVVPLQPQSREKAAKSKLNGALVQLVRIHACHAWGHGFESRTHRNFTKQTPDFTPKNVKSGVFVLVYILSH